MKYKTDNNNNSFGECHLNSSRFMHCMLKRVKKQPECVTLALNNGERILNPTCVKLGGLIMHSSKLLKYNASCCLDAKRAITQRYGNSIFSNVYTVVRDKNVGSNDSAIPARHRSFLADKSQYVSG